MTEMDDFNTKVIKEFRANGGLVGGPFEGMPIVLVHHTGRKSGTERVNPLAYQAVDGGWAVFASKAGAPEPPDWYHNLKANPATTIEVGSETRKVVAREAEGEERDRIWTAQKQLAPTFAEYEAKAGRVIPVIVLDRAD